MSLKNLKNEGTINLFGVTVLASVAKTLVDDIRSGKCALASNRSPSCAWSHTLYILQ